MRNFLHFCKDLPTIYLVFICFIILIFGFFLTQDQNLFVLANLALGAIIGIARGKTPPGEMSQDTDITIAPGSVITNPPPQANVTEEVVSKDE